MKTVLVQLNPTVGALEANAQLVIDQARYAAAEGARLVIFPELVLSGYPPEDLILKDHFCTDCEVQLERLRTQLPPEPMIVVGTPILREGFRRNAAVVFRGGRIVGEYFKMLLPNYGVFDEKRFFEPGTEPLVLDASELRVAFHICEDSWEPSGAAIKALPENIDLLVNLSASPYHFGKLYDRAAALQRTARTTGAALLCCNLIGGQDDLVFDGGSMIFTRQGALHGRASRFQQERLCYDGTVTRIEPLLDPLEEVYTALKLGLHDYVEKTGFKRVLVALSGGIDSALVMALAADALGKERVTAVTMPSRFSSRETIEDAGVMARNIGVEIHQIPIETLHRDFERMLSSVWGAEKTAGLAEENLQARIRGSLVMALSNEYGWLVLATGNKSEMATGYCTLYGDMCGGFALIKDVPKTLVFELCRWRNEQSEKAVIPPSIIKRPPSAELRAGQKDTDSLPPYEILDPILEAYVEQNLGIDGLIEKGFSPELVRRVVLAVEQNEYKRRQAPPGVKITPRSFGRDRRMPIVNRYRN